METGAGDLVGRSGELDALRVAVLAGAAGEGRAVFVLGEPGIGKTRLTTAATGIAIDNGVLVLRGRASTVGPMMPYRPLVEAVMGLSRAGLLPGRDRLGPYAGVLGQLIPELAESIGTAGPAEALEAPGPRSTGSPIVVAEGLLRLLTVVGEGCGCLLVLDDLHDADAETLAIAEYLLDNIAQAPLSLVLTSRREPGAATDLATAARHRGVAEVLEPRRLSRSETAALTAGLLGTSPDQLPHQIVELIAADSAGIPFYVEELVYDLDRSGRLHRGPDGWALADADETHVPESVARSISRRTDQLGAHTRSMLTLAAVIGQRFSLRVLREATGVDDRTMLAGLHAGVAAQLVGADDPAPDWYAFRHPLTADALLSELTLPERAVLSRAAAEAIETLFPDLPGEWGVRAAELWQQAGEPVRAGELFAWIGREAMGDGAVASAVALFARAETQLAAAGDAVDPYDRAEVLDSLLSAVSESGQLEHLSLVTAAVDELTRRGLPASRFAMLHAELANVAMTSGNTVEGRRQLALARELLGAEATDSDLARINDIAAYVELATPGPDRLEVAAGLAGQAAAAAERAGMAVTACDALQMQGYLVRHRDWEEAADYFERAAKIADEHSLRVWRVYSDVFLARGDWVADGSTEALDRAAQDALRLGAAPVAYEAKGVLVLDLLQRAEYDRATTQLAEIIDNADRLRLGRALPYLRLIEATLFAHQGRRQEMEAVLDPLESDPDRAPFLPHAADGMARAVCSLIEDDLPRAETEIARAVAADSANPIMLDFGRYGLAPLLGVLTERHGWDEIHVVDRFAASRGRWNRQFVQLAHAVLLGRDGDAAAADAEARAAREAAEIFPLTRHLGWRLVAEHAHRDGWGEPVEWLRQAEQYFHEGPCPAPALAAACRQLLRQMGAMVRQRRTGSDRVPDQLRRLGVTIREYEVAELLADRIGNKAIGGRLHISPRTVEKHVANLLAKTGEPDRESFASNARTVHGVD